MPDNQVDGQSDIWCDSRRLVPLKLYISELKNDGTNEKIKYPVMPLEAKLGYNT